MRGILRLAASGMGIALSILLAPPLRGAAPATEPVERELFLERPRVVQVALCPRGERVAYLLREDPGSSVWILDGETGRKTRRLRAKSVSRLAWSRDGGGLFLEAGDRVAFLPRDEGRPSFVLRLDPLREQEYRGVDPVFPRHILVTEESPEGEHRLLRIDPSGQARPVYRSSSPIHSFLLDDEGQVAFLTGADGLELVVYRPHPGRGGEGKEEIFRCTLIEPCGLLVAGSEAGRLLLLARPEGDLWKLTAWNPERKAQEILHEDPRGLADLNEVLLDPLDGTPLLASYDTDGLRNYPLSPGVGGHLSRLEGLLPEGQLEVQPRGRRRPFWLIAQALPTAQRRRFYLYDTRRQALRPILEEERLSVPELPREVLSEKKHLSYLASDGREVHGFLSLPRGVDPERAPLVARIHGGPWNHIRQGFDPFTQFLTSRGYVVFEPNFRASTGYGLQYVLAAKGEFGDGRVHQDIVDGVRHLLDQGIGDPTRVAIFGHSFGGFSALGAVAFSPELFRAGIASAPAIDLLRALDDVDEETRLANGLPQRELVRRMVLDPGDTEAEERLRRNSPETRLAETARPLLIMAGAKDEKIPLVDVEHYALALDGLGKDVSLLVDEDSGHSFLKPVLRSAYLYLIERFLAHHLGGALQPDGSPRIDGYLESRLLLTGESLRSALEDPGTRD